MRVLARLKELYKDWLEPPAIRRLRSRSTGPAETLQKMWSGAPVAAPPREREYFHSLGLEAQTITRRDDSRACAPVGGELRLPLDLTEPAEAVQVAITADAWGATSAVTIGAGSADTSHTALRPGRWLDVRIDLPPGAQELTVKSDMPVWVSHPRVVRRRAPGPKGSRHVVLMVLDGMSRRMLEGCHPTSPDTPVTPNIDRLFVSGLDAPFGFAVSDWTLPTTASFFTGVVPSRHRMVHPVFPMKYPAGRRLLAEIFQDAGYHTLALSAGNRLTPAFGAHRGFDRFIYHWAAEGRSVFDYDPPVWVGEIVGHIALHQQDRTFTYVHFPDTHPPWDIPPFTRAFNLARRGSSTGHNPAALEKTPIGREQGRQLLLLRLHELDRALGALVDYIERNIADRAIVVLTADHGTPWYDFPASNPKDRPSLNEFRIGTFLRLRAPGVAATREAGPVCPNLDLMPTLLGLTGLPAPPDLDGVNLLAHAGNHRKIVSESVYRDVYEVAVSDREAQWIEKYPLDEQRTRLTGPAFMKGRFPVNSDDYRSPVATVDPVREEIVQEHIRRVGIFGD